MKKRTTRSTEAELPSDVSALAGWKRARHVLDPTRAKVPTCRITINLDADIIAAFKAEAFRGGPPYQIAINQALRAHLSERLASDEERAAMTVLTALGDREVVRRIRRLTAR
jgi:uncharacterized protein (DUF4415 family)